VRPNPSHFVGQRQFTRGTPRGKAFAWQGGGLTLSWSATVVLGEEWIEEELFKLGADLVDILSKEFPGPQKANDRWWNHK
jgi:hypothetical protein